MSKDISHEVSRVKGTAVVKALPYMRDECKRLGINMPTLEFARGVKIEEGDITVHGTYSFIAERITINDEPIIYGLKEAEDEWDKTEVMHDTMEVMFHEFKHHIDTKLFSGSRDEYLEDYWLHKREYEKGADDYASEMMAKYRWERSKR